MQNEPFNDFLTVLCLMSSIMCFTNIILILILSFFLNIIVKFILQERINRWIHRVDREDQKVADSKVNDPDLLLPSKKFPVDHPIEFKNPVFLRPLVILSSGEILLTEPPLNLPGNPPAEGVTEFESHWDSEWFSGWCKYWRHIYCFVQAYNTPVVNRPGISYSMTAISDWDVPTPIPIYTSQSSINLHSERSTDAEKRMCGACGNKTKRHFTRNLEVPTFSGISIKKSTQVNLEVPFKSGSEFSLDSSIDIQSIFSDSNASRPFRQQAPDVVPPLDLSLLDNDSSYLSRKSLLLLPDSEEGVWNDAFKTINRVQKWLDKSHGQTYVTSLGALWIKKETGRDDSANSTKSSDYFPLSTASRESCSDSDSLSTLSSHEAVPLCGYERDNLWDSQSCPGMDVRSTSPVSCTKSLGEIPSNENPVLWSYVTGEAGFRPLPPLPSDADKRVFGKRRPLPPLPVEASNQKQKTKKSKKDKSHKKLSKTKKKNKVKSLLNDNTVTVKVSAGKSKSADSFTPRSNNSWDTIETSLSLGSICSHRNSGILRPDCVSPLEFVDLVSPKGSISMTGNNQVEIETSSSRKNVEVYSEPSSTKSITSAFSNHVSPNSMSSSESHPKQEDSVGFKSKLSLIHNDPYPNDDSSTSDNYPSDLDASHYETDIEIESSRYAESTGIESVMSVESEIEMVRNFLNIISIFLCVMLVPLNIKVYFQNQNVILYTKICTF